MKLPKKKLDLRTSNTIFTKGDKLCRSDEADEAQKRIVVLGGNIL